MPTGEKRSSPDNGRAGSMRDGKVTARALAALASLAFALVLAGPSLAQEETTATQGGRDTPVETVPGEALAPPEIEAGAWALADLGSGRLLGGEGQDERMPLGSTTKVMSALVALEAIENGDVSLDDGVIISPQAEEFVGSVYSNVGLMAGESVTVRELLEASLIPSGTEAVYALAEHVGGGGGESSVERFVGLMNDKAGEMGLRNTRFDSPAGLDSPDNYSSARDMAEISREAMGYPEFRENVAQPEATISTDSREIEVFNTNALLISYPPATGIKTGTTEEGGPSLVASAEEGGESYVSVVLDAVSADGTEGDRFADAQAVLDYGFANNETQVLANEGDVYGEVEVPFRRGETVELAAAEDVEALVAPGTEFERRVTTDELPPSAQTGDRLGEVEIFVDGLSVGQSPLLATNGYEEASFFQKTWYRVSGLWN
jgi:serine-type D-Ala-D-Ala carboxypeptidase (penicillin-binding protein 5/6)